MTYEKDYLEYFKSLEIMCKRCENHEICQGTWCQPKKDIQDLIFKYRKLKDDKE